jgi:hypothetical protein
VREPLDPHFLVPNVAAVGSVLALLTVIVAMAIRNEQLGTIGVELVAAIGAFVSGHVLGSRGRS